MSDKSPLSARGQTFYNDMQTNHDLSALSSTNPSPPPPTHTSSPDTEKRVADIESKLDSILFILSSQSAKLTALSNKFDRLCEITGVEISDDKPVEAHMKDYEMKFDNARENAEQATLERKRTNSDASKAGMKPVGAEAERKRAMSITRSCREVKVVLWLKIFLDSVAVVDEEAEVKALQYDEFGKLNAEITEKVTGLWEEKQKTLTVEDVAAGMELDLSKWVMKLEEDGNVASLTTAPTRMTSDDAEIKSAEELYKGWYYRNVLKGKQLSYQVDFRVDMKTM